MGSNDIALLAALGVGFVAWRAGYLNGIISQLKGLTGGLTGGGGGGGGSTQDTSGGGGGGLQTSAAGAGKTIYPATGKAMTATDTGKTTRHYASGGSSATTERAVKNCPFSAFEMTTFANVPADEMTCKMYGPNHTDSTRAWYLFDVNSAGNTFFGWEDPHPKTTKNAVKGPSAGNVKSVVGIKGVIWPVGSGAHVEGWINNGGGWKKMMAANNPAGKSYTKAGSQEVLFRIDTRPVTFQSAVVQEIRPPAGAAAAYGFPLTAQAMSAQEQFEWDLHDGVNQEVDDNGCSNDEDDVYEQYLGTSHSHFAGIPIPPPIYGENPQYITQNHKCYPVSFGNRGLALRSLNYY